jgi:Tfp pilus assembly protein PilO
MKRLTPAKRNQLITVLLFTAAMIGSVYFMLIRPENRENHRLIQETNDRRADLNKYKEVIGQSQATSNQLVAVSLQLQAAEKDIASGDVYAWIYDTIRRFKENYHLNIPTIGQPMISENDLIPNYPYKQVRLSLSGTGYYHNLGKFVSDFENTFPHMRIVNLAIGATDSAEDSEILSFHFDVVALVKPTS